MDFIPEDVEVDDAIINDIIKAKEDDNFQEFKNAFYDRFIIKKQSYKGKEYYSNYCYYQNGKFNLKYIINNKKYQESFSMKELASTDEGKIFFRKVFSVDEKQKNKDKLMQDIKPDIYYYIFNFYIFKAILCKYLFEFKHKKDLKIWDTDFGLFMLLKDKNFMSIVNKFDIDKKSSFYGLLE